MQYQSPPHEQRNQSRNRQIAHRVKTKRLAHEIVTFIATHDLDNSLCLSPRR